jgi:hypothetical protein
LGKIEEGLKRELSCSYAYVPDMTPGVYQGEAYDGRMTKIVGNHVAVVVAGRAGPDVLIGDSKPETLHPPADRKEQSNMKTNLSRTARYVQAAAAGFLSGKLAADAKPDLSEVFASITGANFKASKPAIIAGIAEATKGKLAAGAKLDDLPAFLGAFDEMDDDDKDKKPVADKRGAKDEEGETDEEKADRLEAEAKALRAKGDKKGAKDKRGAKDSEEETEEEKAARLKRERADDAITPAAMDAAIASANTATEKRLREAFKAVDDARRFVRPWVGELALACDSAEEVERAAATILKIPDADKVHHSALRPLIKMTPKPGERTTPGLANDSRYRPADDAEGFAKRYPNAAKIRVI